MKKEIKNDNSASTGSLSSRIASAVILAGCLGISNAYPQDAQTAKPDQTTDKKTLTSLLKKSEDIATITTSNTVKYAALCRSAAYAFRLAEPEGEKSSDYAKQGYELADRARKLNPKGVEAEYRYALCLGIYLRENTLEGMSKVNDLIASAKHAIELDEKYDKGGPHRILAILYSEAPRFVGPGDHALAQKHLKRLLEIAGEDEENKITEARVYIELGESTKAKTALARTDQNKMDQSQKDERKKLQHKLND